MKKIIATILSAAMITAAIPVIAANDEIKVYLDGKQIMFDVPPQIINDRTLVPMRAILEALEASVSWDADTRMVTAEKPGVNLLIAIDSTYIARNTIICEIDVPAKIIDDRTLIPLRAVSECFGVLVDYNGDTKTITMKSTDKIAKYDWNNEYIYYGELEDGKPKGYGAIYSSANNSLVAMGMFDIEKSSNIIKGTLYSPGAIYYGDYDEHGVITGQGTMTFYDGTISTGYFKNGQLCGQGTVSFPSGDKFEGNFSNGSFDGQGTFTSAKGGYYSGNYTNGYRNGQGTWKSDEGVIYVGEWKNNTMDGYGELTLPDGDCYTGYFMNNSFNGYGDYYSATYNYTYSGLWVNGKKNGEFSIYDHTLNKTLNAYYDNDSLISY